MTYRRRLLILPLILLVSCEDCDDSSGLDNNCNVVVIATINGGGYLGCHENAFNSSGNLNVASNRGTGSTYMALNFGAAAAVGTTTIGSGVPTSFQIENSSGAVWIANSGQGSGSLTIATLTGTGATGTFLFTAPPASGGATGNMVVTGGTFNVTF